jgi:hypothetical protein
VFQPIYGERGMLDLVLADTDYVRAAYVRGGRPAVVESVIFHLHRLGLIVPARPGTIRRQDSAQHRVDGFERIVWNAVVGDVAPGALVGRLRVDAALVELRARCVHAGLTRRFVPASWPMVRPRAGRVLVKQLRAGYPLEVGDDLTMLVALYGRDALERYAPRFAKDSGLLDRTDSDNFGSAEAGPQGDSGLQGGSG